MSYVAFGTAELEEVQMCGETGCRRVWFTSSISCKIYSEDKLIAKVPRFVEDGEERTGYGYGIS